VECRKDDAPALSIGGYARLPPGPVPRNRTGEARPPHPGSRAFTALGTEGRQGHRIVLAAAGATILAVSRLPPVE